MLQAFCRVAKLCSPQQLNKEGQLPCGTHNLLLLPVIAWLCDCLYCLIIAVIKHVASKIYEYNVKKAIE
jgi:hypothetical protein